MVTKDPQKIAQGEIDSLRNSLLTQLESEARSLFNQMLQQFSDQLQAQSDQAAAAVTQLLGGGGLVTAGLQYVLQQPQITTTASETQRSVDANAQFRLSQAQALAEAGVTLSKGNKNL